MLYDVFYDLGCCEGWAFKTFDSFSEALQFAEKQIDSRIVGYHQGVPVAYNIYLLY